MKCSETLDKIAPAMVKVTEKLHNLYPGAKGYSYTYVTLADVIDELKLVLPGLGLSYMQFPSESPNGESIALETIVMHESGQYISEVSTFPLTNLKGGNDTQMAGSAITYGRRYALMAVFGIAGDKDLDGTISIEEMKATLMENDGTLRPDVNEAIKAALASTDETLIRGTYYRVVKYIKAVNAQQKVNRNERH